MNVLNKQPILPSGGSTTGFGPHFNEVMASPRVFAIYWGRDYGAPTTGLNARAATLDRFFSMVMTSRYLDMLVQYGVAQGTFLGSTWVDHAPGLAQTFDFNQVRDVLIAWLDAGMLPVVPAWNETDLLYVIFPPTEVTLTDTTGAGGFCAYHWYGHYRNSPVQKANLFFAVVDTTSNTAAVGHELSEAFTDRALNSWYSDDGSEIADICSFCGSTSLTLLGFPVASYWLVDVNRCLQQADLTPGPPPPRVPVPLVIGLTSVAAIGRLQSVGFLVHETDTVDNTCENIGVVTGQSPRAGTAAIQGSTVTIWVGKRPPHPCP